MVTEEKAKAILDAAKDVLAAEEALKRAKERYYKLLNTDQEPSKPVEANLPFTATTAPSITRRVELRSGSLPHRVYSAIEANGGRATTQEIIVRSGAASNFVRSALAGLKARHLIDNPARGVWVLKRAEA